MELTNLPTKGRMGSPISVALAEITMQKIEQLVFENPPCDSALWIRYVDDALQ